METMSNDNNDNDDDNNSIGTVSSTDSPRVIRNGDTQVKKKQNHDNQDSPVGNPPEFDNLRQKLATLLLPDDLDAPTVAATSTNGNTNE